MPEDKNEAPTTYTPRTTRRETVTLEAPHGDTREIEFKLYAGTTYEIVAGQEAEKRIGWGAISQQEKAIRKAAADAAKA